MNTMMNEQNNVAPFTLKNAKIILRNFAGQARPPYTPEGARNFMLVLPDELADQLKTDGWNVSYLKNKYDPDEPDTPAIRVAVNYKYHRPPEIYRVVGTTKTLLSEDTVSVLDNDDIVKADLRVRPRPWQNGNSHGIKAYLEKMYVTVAEDELDADYNFDSGEDVPF